MTTNNAQEDKYIRIAREIAIETDAITPNGKPWLDRVGSINIDCQLLAYKICDRRIKAHEIDADQGRLFNALEQVFCDAVAKA